MGPRLLPARSRRSGGSPAGRLREDPRRESAIRRTVIAEDLALRRDPPNRPRARAAAFRTRSAFGEMGAAGGRSRDAQSASRRREFAEFGGAPRRAAKTGAPSAGSSGAGFLSRPDDRRGRRGDADLHRRRPRALSPRQEAVDRPTRREARTMNDDRLRQ